ncbi:polysaccharide biosynthesis protein GtrA [Acetobacter orleanensis]|nr:GtrA family protein [Acetobacter orleanensis]KXV62927.1 polysaccharide biosynthesis protein GtrA [Acetobacter orleanensis]PCD80763.1 GtrA family protein [Acetobacter orleanensis]
MPGNPASPSDSDTRAKLIRLLKFGTVGGLGFLWDSGTVYALRTVIGLTAATLVAYFVAATLNWMLNRLWTFKGAGQHDHPVLQWLRFLLANSFGFLLNRGTVYTLFYTVPLCVTYPVLALAAGSLAGMFANFNLSQKMVFREKPPASVQELAESAIAFPESPQNTSAEP